MVEQFGGYYDGGENIPNIGNDGGEGNEGSEGDKFSVPEAYQEKGWAKDLNSVDDVFKKLDGAETLIGQRPAGIELPKEDSTPEEMASFYGSLGRPEKADGYTFNRDGQSDAMKEFNSDEVDSAVKTMFHKFGLTSAQASGIQTEYEALISSMVGDKLETNKKSDVEFEELTTKAFGNDKESILENAKILLENHTPKGFEEYVKTLDNNSLTVIAGVLNDVKSKYISEDVFNNLNNGGGGGGNSKEELRLKAQKLMTSKEYTNEFHPDNAKVVQEAKELYAKIAQME